MGAGGGAGATTRRDALNLGAARPRSGAVPFAVAAAALAAAWFGGLALQLRQPVLWASSRYALLLGLSAVLAALVAGRGRQRRWLLLAVAVAAFAQAGLRASLRLADALPPVLEGQDLQVVGVVSSMPRSGPQGVRFAFEVESAWHQGEPVVLPQRVSLGWWRSWGEEVQGPAPWDGLAAGQRWRFTVRLRQPHGPLNPGGFDLELWMFEQSLRASGSVRGAAQRLDEGVGHRVDRWRQALRDALLRTVPDPRAAGVLAALAVGDQAAIEREDWELFRITGVAHLMSISGLHVTLFAWLAGAVVGALWRRSGRAMHWCATPVAARWGGVVAAGGYALLAGWGVPAQRTVWMLATVALLRSAGVHWPWPLVLAVAGVVVTALDPWALLQPGFWLSFAAVGLLMASEAAAAIDTSPARGWRATVREGLRTQVVATVGLAPLTLVCFEQLSLVGFAANLIAVPLVTLAITPLALAGVLLPPLWTLGAGLVQALAALLTSLAALPGAMWTAGAAPLWAQAAGLLGGALAVLPLPWRMRLLALPLMAPLLWPPQALPTAGRFELLAADVGQGTAVLVRTREHLLLYDTGPQYTPDADAAQRVLLPLLRWRGERDIDRLVISHRDLDHAGGAASLLAHWPVRALSSSLEPSHPLRRSGPPHRPCLAGEGWQWDGVQFAWLHPPAELIEQGHDATTPNALSCVLRVSDAAGRSVLLTGDIEAAQERALIERSGAQRLHSDVLLVPHHGSNTSSTEAFVQAVAPHTAMVQAGHLNRYGHPAPAVRDRYRGHGITLVRSDHCGAWTWDGEQAVCERDRSRRYWHHRP